MSAQEEQLRSVYAQMMDGELLETASDMGNLTELARPLLRAELKRRGLDLGEDTPVEPIVLQEADLSEDEEQLIPIPDYDGKCPVCGSLDIIFLEREQRSELEPELPERFHWICDSCQLEWSDDGLQVQ